MLHLEFKFDGAICGVALTTFKDGLNSRFLSQNARIPVKSARHSAQRGSRLRSPSYPAKSTVFKILTETNMNSKSTKNGIGPNEIHPKMS